MENLETQILDRLNKVLKNNNLIIKSTYPSDDIYLSLDELFEGIRLFNFGLFKSIDHSCLYCWNTFYDMLFSHQCIFNVYNKIKYCIEDDSLFNVCDKIKYCKGDSLEEIMIKMDLIGI